MALLRTEIHTGKECRFEDWPHTHNYYENGTEGIDPLKEEDTMNKIKAEDMVYLEIDRLKGLISEMSVIIGMLRGFLFEFEDSFKPNKVETMRRIDKKIELMFYTPHFREKQ